MNKFILIALLTISPLLAAELILVGTVSNDGGYVISIEDTDVSISADVASAVNLADWVGQSVSATTESSVAVADGARVITVTAITAIEKSVEEE